MNATQRRRVAKPVPTTLNQHLKQLRHHFYIEALEVVGASVPLLIIGTESVLLTTTSLSCRVSMIDDRPLPFQDQAASSQQRLEQVASAVERCFQISSLPSTRALYILINRHPDLKDPALCHVFLAQLKEIFPLIIAGYTNHSLHVVYSDHNIKENEAKAWICNSIADSKIKRLTQSSIENTRYYPRRTLAEFDIQPCA